MPSTWSLATLLLVGARSVAVAVQGTAGGTSARALVTEEPAAAAGPSVDERNDLMTRLIEDTGMPDDLSTDADIADVSVPVVDSSFLAKGTFNPKWTGWNTIPGHNVTFCSIPKAGSSMIRALIAYMTGHLTPGKLPGPRKCEYGWTLPLGKEGDKLTNLYDPNMIKIAITRDPWTRAVSQYGDQLHRQHFHGKENSTHDFLTYLRAIEAHDSAVTKWRWHIGNAADMCLGGWLGNDLTHGKMTLNERTNITAKWTKVKWDQVVNLEAVEDFEKLSRDVTYVDTYLNHGWKACTGVESLVERGSIAHHAVAPSMKNTLCDHQSLSAVARVYQADYHLYESMGHKFNKTCCRAPVDENTGLCREKDTVRI